MSPHVSKTCNESDGIWLPLIEYSVKTGVSLSTIRRKIKNNSIQYRLEKGRYLILHREGGYPSIEPTVYGSDTVPGLNQGQSTAHGPGNQGQAVGACVDVDGWEDLPLSGIKAAQQSMAVSGDEQKLIPMVEKAVQMVSDAFEFALVQKEEQVRLLEAHNRQLEDRIGELKMLVQLMEDKYQVRY